jgi:aquaporin Z
MKSIRNKADIARQQRMEQPQLQTDFLNSVLEWRRIFAEAWGTFLLVVVAAGGEVVAARSGGAVTPGMVPRRVATRCAVCDVGPC